MMTTDTDIIKVPDLLNKDFFKKSLENGLKLSNVEIHDLNITKGSSGGENYCSEIYRARIKYTQNQCENYKNSSKNNLKNISLIVKYMDLSTEEKDYLQDMKVYEREKKMYFEVIPALEKLLGENIILAPRCFYAVEKPITSIVFQDMCELEYEVADRVNGLDEKHIELLLEKIAKFHAASMVLAEKEPSLIKAFSRSFFHSNNSIAKDTVFLGNLDYLANLIDKKWPDYYTIAEKIRKIKDHFYELALETVELNDQTIAVLNHGDLWVNNMLFKRSNNIPTDVTFIDLQLSFYGSLGVDLHYFLNTSVPTEILKTKRYDLLRLYFGHLKTTLKKLSHKKIPTWEQFKNEMRATEFYGFFAYEAILPLITLDRETSKNNSFETFSNEEQSEKNREKAFNSKRLLEMTKYSVDRFDELEVFDK